MGQTISRTRNGTPLTTTTDSGNAQAIATNTRGDLNPTGNDSPAILQTDDYTPWGQPTTTPANTTGIGYRGELHTTGLIHLRNRAYDPTTATFLTRDPLDGHPGHTTLANPYHYAHNNPITFTDPLGLSPLTDRTLVGLGVGGTACGRALSYRIPGTFQRSSVDEEDLAVCSQPGSTTTKIAIAGAGVAAAGGITIATGADQDTNDPPQPRPGPTPAPPPPGQPDSDRDERRCNDILWRIDKYGRLKGGNGCERHHIIQDAAVDGTQLPGHARYTSYSGTAILLTRQQHLQTYGPQRTHRRCGTYAIEREVAVEGLVRTRIPAFKQSEAIAAADRYFIGDLGFTMSTPTRKVAGRPC